MIVMTIDTPEAMMLHALDGRLSKHALASLLAPAARPVFFDACARIERRYTHACASTGDPCLESGCACEGEACLQPLLRAGSEYLKACGVEWNVLFADAPNRDQGWRLTAETFEHEA